MKREFSCTAVERGCTNLILGVALAGIGFFLVMLLFAFPLVGALIALILALFYYYTKDLNGSIYQVWKVDGTHVEYWVRNRRIGSFEIADISEIIFERGEQEYGPSYWVIVGAKKFHVHCLLGGKEDMLRYFREVHEKVYGERRLDQALPPKYRKISPFEP